MSSALCRRAGILDEGRLRAFAAVAQQLSAADTVELADRMLEQHSSTLEPVMQTALITLFGGGRHVAGQYRPLDQGRLVEALALPDMFG